MKILDTNVANYILKNHLTLSDNYYVTDDITEEIELAESVIGNRLSFTVLSTSDFPLFDQALYLKHYKSMLNQYGGRSFYRRSGFGDISILALLKTLDEKQSNAIQGQLFSLEDLVVFTDDKGLRRKIIKVSPKTKIFDKNTVK